MATPIYPLCFWPVYKDYIWGGDRIIRLYQRQEPPGRYAESWEISDRPDGMSMIRNGPLAGKSLADVIQATGPELLGTAVKERRFPLLIKLIDSRDRLSVQVVVWLLVPEPKRGLSDAQRAMEPGARPTRLRRCSSQPSWPPWRSETSPRFKP